jgi:hypothetical protein
VKRSWLQRSMGDLVESDAYAMAIAACVTGQRSGCPHTSGRTSDR